MFQICSTVMIALKKLWLLFLKTTIENENHNFIQLYYFINSVVLIGRISCAIPAFSCLLLVAFVYNFFCLILFYFVVVVFQNLLRHSLPVYSCGWKNETIKKHFTIRPIGDWFHPHHTLYEIMNVYRWHNFDIHNLSLICIQLWSLFKSFYFIVAWLYVLLNESETHDDIILFVKRNLSQVLEFHSVIN